MVGGRPQGAPINADAAQTFATASKPKHLKPLQESNRSSGISPGPQSVSGAWFTRAAEKNTINPLRALWHSGCYTLSGHILSPRGVANQRSRELDCHPALEGPLRGPRLFLRSGSCGESPPRLFAKEKTCADTRSVQVFSFCR
jgi:hypothetical protein